MVGDGRRIGRRNAPPPFAYSILKLGGLANVRELPGGMKKSETPGPSS